MRQPIDTANLPCFHRWVAAIPGCRRLDAGTSSVVFTAPGDGRRGYLPVWTVGFEYLHARPSVFEYSRREARR